MRSQGSAIRLLSVAVAACAIAGCAAIRAQLERRHTMTIAGDSLVLAGQTPGNLCFPDVDPESVTVRSTYEPNQQGTVVYQAGKDYEVDSSNGTLRRTAGSRIPDFSKNVLYGLKKFNHNKIKGIANHPFFVWVDYKTRAGSPLAAKSDQSALLPKTAAKLRAGGPFKIVAYGDSITNGGEASKTELQYQQRWVEGLRKRFPKAQIVLENGATGGDRSYEGVKRLEEKVLARQPDLVLVAFGMNDGATPLPDFKNNLTTIIQTIRERTGAEILLLSTFPPNPEWAFSRGNMGEIASATKGVAEASRCAYADVYSVWIKVLARKDHPSLLGNNINHPNDFGHWLYLEALDAVKF